jgi:hypothetical protein
VRTVWSNLLRIELLKFTIVVLIDIRSMTLNISMFKIFLDLPSPYNIDLLRSRNVIYRRYQKAKFQDVIIRSISVLIYPSIQKMQRFINDLTEIDLRREEKRSLGIVISTVSTPASFEDWKCTEISASQLLFQHTMRNS